MCLFEKSTNTYLAEIMNLNTQAGKGKIIIINYQNAYRQNTVEKI